ncbi:hypothetical protein [Peribacillus huizhouensis]|uniref:DUF4352 domain-containing protein n=1 Tax=Peribacillus huizhouensis TaxID=1501239 RepID=A0ABR6CTT7_9BACI|nr:hypothetical protein [Peribacillus huizhouensis]MBA9028370.1 hypothetical protein [Peribacillus huizhouensis]
MEEKKLGVLGNYIYKYEGTETEKAKNEFINIFKYKLLQYEVTLIFIEKIKMCFVLSIVIQNVGDVQDKNIIDKSVRVFHGDDYLKDDYMPVYLDMIGDEYNFIESIFKFKSDSNVWIYVNILDTKKLSFKQFF